MNRLFIIAPDLQLTVEVDEVEAVGHVVALAFRKWGLSFGMIFRLVQSKCDLGDFFCGVTLGSQ